MSEVESSKQRWQHIAIYGAIAVFTYILSFHFFIYISWYYTIESDFISSILLLAYRPMFFLAYLSEFYYECFMWTVSLAEPHTSTHEMYREWYTHKFGS